MRIYSGHEGALRASHYKYRLGLQNVAAVRKRLRFQHGGRYARRGSKFRVKPKSTWVIYVSTERERGKESRFGPTESKSYWLSITQRCDVTGFQLGPSQCILQALRNPTEQLKLFFSILSHEWYPQNWPFDRVDSPLGNSLDLQKPSRLSFCQRLQKLGTFQASGDATISQR